jgi:hypothetical protein
VSLKTLRVIERELEYLILVATRLRFNNDKCLQMGWGPKQDILEAVGELEDGWEH